MTETMVYKQVVMKRMDLAFARSVEGKSLIAFFMINKLLENQYAASELPHSFSLYEEILKPIDSVY
jgi:hypothetical protein